MDDDEINNDGEDGYWADEIRLRIEEVVDEHAPDLDAVDRTRAIGSLTERVHGEWGDDGDDESPGAVPVLTQEEEQLVRREALRLTRWRDPAPRELQQVRPRTDCRPLRAARRVRRQPTRTRAGPGSDDPDPEPPPRDRAAAP